MAQNLSLLQQRDALVSNTTEKTNGSTQFSDDINDKSLSADKLTVKKHLSNNDSELSLRCNSNSIMGPKTLSNVEPRRLSTG